MAGSVDRSGDHRDLVSFPKRLSSDLEAMRTTAPAPVRVTVDPAMVAGPETTEQGSEAHESEVPTPDHVAGPHLCVATVKPISGAAVPTEQVAFLDAVLSLRVTASVAI